MFAVALDDAPDDGQPVPRPVLRCQQPAERSNQCCSSAVRQSEPFVLDAHRRAFGRSRIPTHTRPPWPRTAVNFVAGPPVDEDLPHQLRIDVGRGPAARSHAQPARGRPVSGAMRSRSSASSTQSRSECRPRRTGASFTLDSSSTSSNQGHRGRLSRSVCISSRACRRSSRVRAPLVASCAQAASMPRGPRRAPCRSTVAGGRRASIDARLERQRRARAARRAAMRTPARLRPAARADQAHRQDGDADDRPRAVRSSRPARARTGRPQQASDEQQRIGSERDGDPQMAACPRAATPATRATSDRRGPAVSTAKIVSAEPGNACSQRACAAAAAACRLRWPEAVVERGARYSYRPQTVMPPAACPDVQAAAERRSAPARCARAMRRDTGRRSK